jgi:hypothetical protein
MSLKEDSFFVFVHKDDSLFKVDYFPTILVGKISKDDAWCLLGLHTFIKSSNNLDNDLMENYSRYIETKIKVCVMFEQLLKKEAKITNVSLNTPTMKNLLYR